MNVDSSAPLPNQSQAAWQYRVPHEVSLAWFIAISLLLFSSGLFLSRFLPRAAELPPMIEIDLEGVENEPAPLGEPEAGAGEVPPEPVPPEPEMQQPELESTPIPEPMPEEPVVEQPPPPEPAPAFVVPEETPPPPKLKPVPAKPAKPAKPTVTRPPTPVSAGSGVRGANIGVRGSPVGQPGGRGGGRGDFVSTPHPQYDATARQRGYEGRGMFLITYHSGRIISVTTLQSTGAPYLDARTIAWVQSRFRVKSGVSGSVRFPIVWQLK